MPLELSGTQIAVLERLAARGFTLVAFPLYASHAGVRRGNCAALLEPAGGGLRLFGGVFYLVGGNPGVRITRGGRSFFVWKKQELEVTPERSAELEAFARDLAAALEPPPA